LFAKKTLPPSFFESRDKFVFNQNFEVKKLHKLYTLRALSGGTGRASFFLRVVAPPDSHPFEKKPKGWSRTKKHFFAATADRNNPESW
jgi:hypothetical protein